MRKLLAAAMLALAAFAAGPAIAADLPHYPDYPDVDVPDLPPADYGMGGSFYLRGSASANLMWAHDAVYGCSCGTITGNGYGYSFGAGFGYETGDGLRADLTVDQLYNNGLSATGSGGNFTLALRSTIGLMNVYYDFGLSGYKKGHGKFGGGFGGYVGLGLGAAYNYSEVTSGCACVGSGTQVSAAGALMAGVTYDMGQAVADLGYRMVYMPTITNQAAFTPYYINNNVIHEVRGTLRYRFN